MKEFLTATFGDEVNFTIDELNYQDILDKPFKESKEIIIFTYNIDNHMIKKLKQLKDTVVHLIINNLTINKIEDLVELLPEKFKKIKLNLYLCIFNHAKMILTDKYFYFGSANFTNYSSRNYEIGTYTETTPQLVEKVKKHILNLSTKSALIGYPELLIQNKIDKFYKTQHSVYDENYEYLVEKRINDTVYFKTKSIAKSIENKVQEIMEEYDLITDEDFKKFIAKINLFINIDENIEETWELYDLIDTDQLTKHNNNISDQVDSINDQITDLENMIYDNENNNEVNLEYVNTLIKDVIDELLNKKNSLSSVQEALEEITTRIEDMPSIDSQKIELRREMEFDGNIEVIHPIIYLPDENITENINFIEIKQYLREEVKPKLKEQFEFLEARKSTHNFKS
ncbi:phospholipase D-like domain-containing protein [Gottfriedia acidiceleris]|uniref:phospholipase D-like domain-containing protein n=1 Tax=Gottfriedia acidiceleris TaxID=371036 RepID=UPI000B43BC5B|nr:phospholipase D-like domain-containing protein [Gottfriedia acidiceleris]